MSDQTRQARGGAVAPTPDGQPTNGIATPNGSPRSNGANGSNGHGATNGANPTVTLDAFYGPNAGYVLELYDRYLADPATVDPDTRAYFATVPPEALTVSPEPVATTEGASVVPVSPSSRLPVSAIVGAVGLAASIREYGHLAVHLDPLGTAPPGAPELDAAAHGISDADLAALPAEVVAGPAAAGAANAQDAIARLRSIYSGKVGYDFDSVQAHDERIWLRDAVETGQFTPILDPAAKTALLERLSQVEGFEKFLHQTYLGAKRFSIEGTDVLVPLLDEIIHEATTGGVREIAIGMAHRGRLNVLTHILEKPYDAMIRAFEGGAGHNATAASDGPDDLDATGDVKYHLGAKLARVDATGALQEVPLVLAPNPSHLEFVNPVVVGMVRAAQDVRDKAGPPAQDVQGSMGILLHGDAAFPGQGVVPETLNLSRLAGYRTGGTIHIIVNNQIGYTTDTHDARSTLYASDLAKGFEIPIVHVSADDPLSCLLAARMAIAYRTTFQKDFLIDLVGYRRWGHNEGDEPLFTQPQMYKEIKKHPTVRKVWADQLVADGIVTAEQADAIDKAVLQGLADIRKDIAAGAPSTPGEVPPRRARHEPVTALPPSEFRAIHDALHTLPDGFKPSGKLMRIFDARRDSLASPDAKLDWAHAESMAFAAILAGGIPVRLSGQDAERGTFSQRHLVLHDATTGQKFTPLHAIPQASASFAVYNSPLSEMAVVGFEYGYDIHAESVLTLWEAQFGDFVNGAQVHIDQFLVAARSKWEQKPALVLLLPHGFEGQGPEHSSARLERFLQLSAHDNIRVCNCTTSAQYFHLLRRQAALLDDDPHPLIVMTPKSLLRHPEAASPVSDFTDGSFRPVLDDPLGATHRDAVTRLVLCSGRVYVDLHAAPDRADPSIAIARVEQLAPFQNTALRGVIAEYPNLTEIVWLQEEPQNMGAWSYMQPRLRALLDDPDGLDRPGLTLTYIGRPERASPAVGSAARHAKEQAHIVDLAFANLIPASSAAESTTATASSNGAAKQAKTLATTSRARKMA